MFIALLATMLTTVQPAHAQQLALVPFANAPFPYDGVVPDTGAPFLDVSSNGRRGHAAPRGGVYWADETYADNRGLLFVPAGFDPTRPALVVVFFHGNNATLERDVLGRQQVAAQVEASRLNAILVAPQFAVDALDSSAGRFWERGAFARWLGEAGDRIAAMTGDIRMAIAFDQMPVLLIAYSGGYLPAAYAATVGGAGGRICGLVLLDAVYGEEARFADWIARREGFFLSSYSSSSLAGNQTLQSVLNQRGISFVRGGIRRLDPTAITFVPAGAGASHEGFVTRAFRPYPITWILSEIAVNGAC
ncbi:MAG: hypothetical protein AB7O56_12895 [Bauldia sp.]